MDNYDAAKWAKITPITAGAECDIADMKAAIFTFDLNAFETACLAGLDCTFDKTVY